MIPRQVGLARTKPRLYDKRYWVFDVETAGLGGAFLDSVLTTELGRHERYRTAAELFERILQPPQDPHGKLKSITVYAHNLGGYDALYLIEEMIEWTRREGVPIDTISRGGKIIGYKIPVERGDGKNVYVTLLDSLPILEVGLQAASTVYAPEYAKREHCPAHDFTKDKNAHYDPDCPVCYAYLEGDCDALLATLRAKEAQEHNVFGINLKVTSGSAGVELLKRTLPKDVVYYRQHPEKEDFLYQCVYGGFVWPGQDTLPHEDVVKRDCTAAYAARAREGVPAGVSAWTGRFETEYPGFYFVTAHVPEDIPIPCVPNRSAKAASGRTPLWPTGTFDTYISSIELEAAELRGCKFEVHHGVVFPRIDFPYNPMMDLLEKMECPEDGAKVEAAVKLGVKAKRNSVVGKAATKRVQERVYLGDAPIGATPVVNPVTGELLPFYVIPEEAKDGVHIQPHWNAWITARQRITVRDILYALGPGARYADTDCVAGDRAAMDAAVASGAIPTSERKKYGTWPVEDEWEWFQVGGPKNYTGVQVGGAKKSKAKGVKKPADPDEFEIYWQAQRDTINKVARPVIEFASTRGARDLLTNGTAAGIGVTRRRSFSTLAGSSTWHEDPARNVRPVHLE